MSALCYNKGCGQWFEPENTPDNACTFHPGVPVFHDALKGWSCCESKTTDFSDFLSIAGCTKGPHNKKKPPEPVKPNVTSSENKDDQKCYEYVISAPKPLVISRPSGDEAMVRLQHKISPSLKQALEKLKLCDNTIQKKEDDSNEIKIGTCCENGGCTKSFEGLGHDEMCSYHVGFPVFHEGMKYWSCCKSKTSDFNTFLSQEGCTTGTHIWRKKDAGKKVVPCRFDWHQTGSQVNISIYAKNSNPDLSYVEANSVALTIRIIFEGEKEFKQNINLWGVIDVSKSVVNMMAAKIEIAMKKSEPVSWGQLHLPPAISPPNEDNENDKEGGDD